MTDYPETMQVHFDGEVTTLCQCWRVTRKDGVVMGFADTDSKVEFDDVTHEPDSGFSGSEARQSLGLAADSVDVEGALSSAGITGEDVLAGRYDGARFDTWLVNWADPSQRALIRSASIGRITLSDGAFLAELESISASLDRPNTRFFRRGCDAALGDAACGVDLDAAGMLAAGSVVLVEAPARLTVTGLDGFSSQWFTHGALNWTSGFQAGRTQIVLAHERDGESAVLELDPDDDLAVAQGDAFTLVAGCDKRFETCKAKFSNQMNFRGFPHLPGNDAAYGYVTEDLPLDGMPVVP